MKSDLLSIAGTEIQNARTLHTHVCTVWPSNDVPAEIDRRPPRSEGFPDIWAT
jgi:hypothetical protein